MMHLHRLRLQYERHLAAGGKPEHFAVERMRPAPATDFALVGTTPKRKTKSTYYRCAFCQEDMKFSAGKVILSADEKVRLIGPDCWKEHFDTEQYKARSRDLSDYEQVRRFAQVRQPLRQEVFLIIRALRTLLQQTRQVLPLIESIPARISHDSTGFDALLRSVRLAGGALTVEDMRPDERYGRDSLGRPNRYRVEVICIHRIAGLEAALTDGCRRLRAEACSAVGQLFTAAEKIAAVPDGVDHNVAASQIRSVIRTLQQVRSKLRLIQCSLDHAQAFLDPQNLRGIAGWADHASCSHPLAKKIAFTGKELFVETEHGRCSLPVLAGMDAATVPDLEELFRLLTLS